MQRVLVLMAKRPEAGATKTRLTALLTPEEASALYACFLLDKIAQMRQVAGVARAVAYYPDEAAGYFARLAPGFTLLPQRGDNLGERLRGVMETLFAQGFRQVVAIDSDTVTLPILYLEQAFARLDDPLIDLSLGPSEDGGYYAIGLKAPCAALFEVRMSTPAVLQQTLAQAGRAGLRASLLPAWYDVDTPADLRRLAAELAGEAHSGKATAAFLGNFDLRIDV